MSPQDISRYQELLFAFLLDIGGKVLAAIVFWVVGRWLIRFAIRLVHTGLDKQKVDVTLQRYLTSALTVTLNVLLVIGVLGYFGVQTTTFAALIAGVGIALGAAWAGLLSNFAAGAFLVVLRPFKVGDFVSVAGITGTVTEVGLFGTTINTPDNVSTLVSNNKVFGDQVQNFSRNPHRRVDLKCQLAASADHSTAMQLLREKVAAIPNVLPEPKVCVEILEFNLVGPVLAVRPSCHNADYWQVYFDANRVMRESLAENGFAAQMPSPNLVLAQAA